ncbi:terpenoid synthase [Mollisia scopiformis]|uniref:Terpenoid synthase n=1 Tax=Mollisia scopiformis TaxID=149040 RepID=A0A132BBJ9_MOLSC|nr:terpenoid synthase [Mollisia scopiformis]KUJ09761.1 terpenoid synthase [Mollisia scopiformis]
MEPQSNSTQVSVADYKNLIQTFLRSASFKLPAFEGDELFTQKVLSFCLSQDLPSASIPATAATASAAAKYFYPSHPPPTQFLLAKFLALTLIIDDLGEDILDGMKNYRTKLLLRQPIGTKAVQSLFDVVSEAGEIYGGWAADMLFKSCLEYLSANALEVEQKGRLHPLRSTPNFAAYLRVKSGIGESFAMLIFDECKEGCEYLVLVPELMRFMEDVNDMMSFYKECMVGDEQENSLCLHARSKGQSLLRSLEEYRTSALACMERIRDLLTENEGLRMRVEEFMMGYMGFHYTDSRYRLGELGLDFD